MPVLSFPCTAAPLSTDDFNAALAFLTVDATTAWTILMVESKTGFLADRRPQILFESAVFHTQTGSQFDATDPDISQPRWVHDYVGGAGEYGRLGKAYALAGDKALMSASWGLGQVMGFNFSDVGCASVTDLVQQACASEAAQLQQFQNYLVTRHVLDPLRDQDWDTVASRYNGSGQVAAYAAALRRNFAELQDPTKIPDLDVRAAQLYLRFLSGAQGVLEWNPKEIDGQWGPNTRTALNAFQTAQGLAATAAVDAAVVASLAAALPAVANLDLS